MTADNGNLDGTPPPKEGEDGWDVLLRQARGGSRDALGELLASYRNYMKLLARLQIDRRLRGKVDASDLVQETFMEAHRDFADFRGQTEAEFAGWLRQILAANLANLVRHYRGTQRRDIRLECELASEMDRSFQDFGARMVLRHSTPSQAASRREQAVLLADALGQLQADYRETIILRHLQGLSFPEVAQRMERSVDSVKKLWARALAQLRAVLGGMP